MCLYFRNKSPQPVFIFELAVTLIVVVTFVVNQLRIPALGDCFEILFSGSDGSKLKKEAQQ